MEVNQYSEGSRNRRRSSKDSKCEGSIPFYTDAEVRRHGDQSGLDTLVVHADNDEC
jgi:hypothetical protein